MNEQEKILAELRNIIANNQHYTTWTVSTPHLVALVNKWEDQVKKAAAQEREECAKVCEEVGQWPSLGPKDCADAIRERGTT